jgi:hypothetical protein
MSAGPVTYVVTDIEADGPSPELNSMLSFAAVAVTSAGDWLAEFEAVLAPRPGHVSDPLTMAWWQGFPEAWAAATADPEPPAAAMARFADWVEALPGRRHFAARPVSFDALWIDRYLQDFAGARVFGGPVARGRVLFHGPALDLQSYAAGRLGWRDVDPPGHDWPADWLGSHPHTHRAIDDARGYASLLIRLMEGAGDQAPARA